MALDCNNFNTMMIKWTFNIVVLLEMVTWCPVLGSCAEGWRENNAYCYYVAKSKATWSEAETRCKQLNANLTSVLDEDEKNFITTITNLSKADYWIGLLRSCDNQTWIWTDGSNTSYTNWLDIQDQQTSGDCVRIVDGGQWSVTTCNTNVGSGKRPVFYLCKQEANKTHVQDDNNVIGSGYSPSRGRHGLELVLPLVLAAVFIVLVIVVDIIAVYYCKRVKCVRITTRSPK